MLERIVLEVDRAWRQPYHPVQMAVNRFHVSYKGGHVDHDGLIGFTYILVAYQVDYLITDVLPLTVDQVFVLPRVKGNVDGGLVLNLSKAFIDKQD